MTAISDQKSNITVAVIQPEGRFVVAPTELPGIRDQKISELRLNCKYILTPPNPQHVDITQIHQKRLQKLDEIEREINELKEDYVRNPTKYKAVNVSKKISLIAFPIIGIVAGSMIGLLLGYGLGKLWKDRTIATRVVFAAIGGIVGLTGLAAISLAWYFSNRRKIFRKHYCKISDDTLYIPRRDKYEGSIREVYLTDKGYHRIGRYNTIRCRDYEEFTINYSSLCREGEEHIDGVLGDLQEKRSEAQRDLGVAREQDQKNLQSKTASIQQTIAQKIEWVRNLAANFKRELEKEFTGLTFRVEVFENVLERVGQQQPMLENAKGSSIEPVQYTQSLASNMEKCTVLYPTMDDASGY